MKTVDMTANLSQKQAKSMFKKYATGIVRILRTRGIIMIKKNTYTSDVDYFSWNSRITEESPAKIYIAINHKKANTGYIVLIDLIAMINYQKDNCMETHLEKLIRRTTENTIDEKYPLSNLRISVVVENPKIPNLDPEKIVARQLYLALKCHNKIYSPETISKVKAVEKRINKLIEEEVNVMVESFFK